MRTVWHIQVIAMTLFIGPSIRPSLGGEPRVYDNWQRLTTDDGMPDGAVQAIHVHEREVWIGTDHGLAALIDERWRRWSYANGIVDYPIAAIAVDPLTQDVWLGTWGGGLVRFSAGRFDHFHQFNSGLPGNLVTAVTVQDSKVWAATNGGICRFDAFRDEWALHYGRQVNRSDTACTGLAWRNGGLLAGLQGTGLTRFDPEQSIWQSVWPTTPNVATAERDDLIGFVATEAGTWLVTSSRIWHTGGDKRLSLDTSWTARQLSDLVPNLEPITCLAASPEGELWLGTENGLRVIAPSTEPTALAYGARTGTGHVTLFDQTGRHKRRSIDSVPPTGDIRCIAFDKRCVWVGTDEGLFRATRRRPWRELTAIDAPPPDAPRHVVGNRTGAGKPAIAIYGPRNRTIALPGGADLSQGESARIDLLATQLAVEGTGSAADRWRPPIDLAVLTPGYAAYGWGLPEDDFVDFASQDNVVGIVGYLSRQERIAEQAIRFARIPFVTFASGRGDLDAPDDPWIFRCHGGAPRQHRMLIDHLIDDLGIKRPAALFRTDRENEPHRKWWRDHAARRGHPLVAEVGAERLADSSEAVAKLIAARPDAILTWDEEDVSAIWLREVRDAGLDALFVGGPAILTETFPALAGSNAGRVLACKNDETNQHPQAVPHFTDAYAERNVVGAQRVAPNADAYSSYEATNHLLEAVRAAGRDRNGVRNILRLMRQSSLGEGHYERLHGPGTLVLGQLTGGEWTYGTIRQTP